MPSTYTFLILYFEQSTLSLPHHFKFHNAIYGAVFWAVNGFPTKKLESIDSSLAPVPVFGMLEALALPNTLASIYKFASTSLVLLAKITWLQYINYCKIL